MRLDVLLITCKDIDTVVSDATSSADDDGYDALSMKVHIEKSELTKLSRLISHLQGKRKYILMRANINMLDSFIFCSGINPQQL